MATVAELMERMLQGVFNEPDPERRDTAIAETFAEDVVFTDAEGTVTGRAALAAKVTGLLAARARVLVFGPRWPADARDPPGTLGRPRPGGSGLRRFGGPLVRSAAWTVADVVARRRASIATAVHGARPHAPWPLRP